MICHLKIHNFILIDDLELDFKSGFSAITGETGAGKSIILDAILFAFGQNISRDITKNSQHKSQITICIESSPQIILSLNDCGIDIDPNEDIIIKRIHNISGKNKFYVNDQLVSKKVVSGIMKYVIEIHGQHSHTALLDIKKHMNILDEFAQNSCLLENVSTISASYSDLEKKIAHIEQRKTDIENDIEYLEYTCRELEQVDIKKGEVEQLEVLRRKLQVREKEIQRVRKIIADIEQQEISQLIAKIQRSISQSSDADKFTEIEAKFEDVYNYIEESLDELRNIEAEMINDDQSFEDVDDRLNLIKELARKHNCLPDELPNFLQKSSEELSHLQNLIIESDDYVVQLSKLRNEYNNAARELSNARKQAALDLQRLVQGELTALEMKKASFVVQVDTNTEQISAKGMDNVYFLAATNPGMPPGAINKVASGGELSRLMLALRAVLFAARCRGKKSNNVPNKMIIFDEIDVGISGSVAESVGVRLKNLSKSTQVLVITHQPQVASKADCHLLVEKHQFDDHTKVKVIELEGDKKSKEIARMISGKEITKTGIKAAEELIDSSI